MDAKIRASPQSSPRSSAGLFDAGRERLESCPQPALTKETTKKHKDLQSRVYPAFGKCQHHGHWGFCSTATKFGEPTLLAFLDAQTNAPWRCWGRSTGGFGTGRYLRRT